MKESKEKTPFGVVCKDGCSPNNETLFLTDKEYDRQINKPNNLWQCPRCGGLAMWDDDNYEKYL